jgi:hypothetical protein
MTTTKPLTANEMQLLRALADTGQEKVSPWRDGRKPWRVVRNGRGWRWTTFHSLKERGYLTIENTFAGGIDVSLTDAGRAAVGAA